MTYLGVDWKVLEASESHLPGGQVETATITLTSLKLKASYDIEMETSSMECGVATTLAMHGKYGPDKQTGIPAWYPRAIQPTSQEQ